MHTLRQDWDESLFGELAAAGGSVYSNYAVGYNNVKVPGATKHKIAVGNTPGGWRSLGMLHAVVLTPQRYSC